MGAVVAAQPYRQRDHKRLSLLVAATLYMLTWGRTTWDGTARDVAARAGTTWDATT
jgi:hypothetical protein